MSTVNNFLRGVGDKISLGSGVYITGEGWIIGPYRMLTSNNKKCLAELIMGKSSMNGRIIRFGRREWERIKVAGKDDKLHILPLEKNIIGDKMGRPPRAAKDGELFLNTKNVIQQHGHSRMEDKSPTFKAWWTKAPADAHHIVEDKRSLDGLGINLAVVGLERNDAPCVLLSHELHLRLVTPVLASVTKQGSNVEVLYNIYKSIYEKEFPILWQIAKNILNTCKSALSSKN